MTPKNQKGFSLVELLVVVIIIGIIAAIAIPSLLASRRAANEASAIASLRTIHSGEVTYQSVSTTNSYGTLAQLGGAKILDTTLGAAAPTKSGYKFTEAASPDATGYCVEGHATSASTGTRAFGVDANGVINVHATTTLTCPATFVITGGSALN